MKLTPRVRCWTRERFGPDICALEEVNRRGGRSQRRATEVPTEWFPGANTENLHCLYAGLPKGHELMATNKDLARKIEQLESVQKQQARTQQQHGTILVSLVQDVQKLKNPPQTRAIGFTTRRSPKKK